MDLRQLSAFRNQRIFAVDANSFFARPGPRVVEGAEILAHLIHPELFEDSSLTNDHEGIFKKVDVGLLQGELNTPDDYYIENGFMVFTGSYLTRRGYCCDSGCRHCPY